jgi:hypothetical protein
LQLHLMWYISAIPNEGILGHMEAKELHLVDWHFKAQHLPIFSKDAQCHEFKRILTQKGWYSIIPTVLQVIISLRSSRYLPCKTRGLSFSWPKAKST